MVRDGLSVHLCAYVCICVRACVHDALHRFHPACTFLRYFSIFWNQGETCCYTLVLEPCKLTTLLMGYCFGQDQ
jgi:hypothetical protein